MAQHRIFKNVSMVFFMINILEISTKVEITNLKCESFDEKFSRIEYCFLKAINRTFRFISIKVNLLQTPVSDASVNIAMFKRANGWRPFLYNVTFDGCKFLRERENPLINYFYRFIKDNSNINHTCPFNHDLILDKYSNVKIERILGSLPAPNGNYALMTKWYTEKKLRFTIDLYATFDS